MNARVLFVSLTVVCVAAPSAFAQTAPPPPPPTWTGSIGAGLAVTNGNADSSNINVSFKAVRDPKTNVVFATEGLYIRGTGSGELTADNAMLTTKVERRLSDRTYAFVQLLYFRDSFKAIDYFMAPTAGLGYRVVDTDKAKLSSDLSVGPSWEQNPGVDVRSKVAVAFGEKASYALSKSATFTQGFAATLAADDWADGLYTFSAGIAASLTDRTQLKCEVVDNYKNKPPTIDIEKNDLSTLASVIYKF